MKIFKNRAVVVIIMLISFVSVSIAEPQKTEEGFPKKPITIYAPYAVGGGVDLTARALSTILPKYLGVSVIVVNKPGGNGALAHSFFKNLDPDGYSLIVTGQSAVTLTPLIQAVDYDPLKDFVYISRVIGLNDMIAVRSDSQFKTMMALIEYSKTHPGQVTCANAGAGGVSYYLIDGINKATGGKLVKVPFSGASEATTAVLSGDAKAYFGSLSSALAFVSSGQMKILAFNSQRDPNYPDVPTLLELNCGIDFGPGNYCGLAGPAGMSPKIVEYIDDAVAKTVKDKDFIAMCNKLKLPIAYLNSKDFFAATEHEIEICKKIVEATDR